MKIAAIILLLTLTSCTRNQYRSALTSAYPGMEYQPIGEGNTKFIVRKLDGSVWEVEINSFNAKVWSEAMLFPPNR